MTLISGGSRISCRGGGRQLPRQLRFEKFVCQNERIGTLGGPAPAAPPGSANVNICAHGFKDRSKNWNIDFNCNTQVTQIFPLCLFFS